MCLTPRLGRFCALEGVAERVTGEMPGAGLGGRGGGMRTCLHPPLGGTEKGEGELEYF